MTVVERETVLDRLARHAVERRDHPAYVFLGDGGSEEEHVLTYGALDRAVRAIAASLRERLNPGERVLLLIPDGPRFIPAFFGCLAAGLVAVPALPPHPGSARTGTLRAIAADCRPAGVITGSPQGAAGRAELPELERCRWVSVDELADSAPSEDLLDTAAPRAADIAFLQYTSGSTALPKGVVVSHRALAHNQEMIRGAFGHDASLTGVSWLPLFHDMGLIGNVIQPLWVGGSVVLMSPADFVKRPAAWLRAISRYRAQTSGGPNLGYELCVSRVRDSALTDVDLSCWKVAYNGAEPVRDATLRAFASRFARYGFDPAATHPCYGLAEATLLVTAGPPGEAPSRLAIDERALAEGRILPRTGGRTLVGCGKGWRGREVAVVDPVTRRRVAADRVGEIWLAGPGLAEGYWGDPVKTEHDFRAALSDGTGPYLRTGDLGFLHEGELYITGRIKDLIIVGGRNHYPQDLEATAEAVVGGRAVAFGLGDAEDAVRERVVIVLGARAGGGGSAESRRAQAARSVREAVAAEHGVVVADVVLVGLGEIPLTSSGKPRRSACRAAYLSGSYARR